MRARRDIVPKPWRDALIFGSYSVGALAVLFVALTTRFGGVGLVTLVFVSAAVCSLGLGRWLHSRDFAKETDRERIIPLVRSGQNPERGKVRWVDMPNGARLIIDVPINVQKFSKRVEQYGYQVVDSRLTKEGRTTRQIIDLQR